ncbi:hypothetical protein [Arthrobacter sp. VKM Ac-2550]|uniref:hypothetical protein n=1 Tax=Crystallibacter permensis TaxID=1938888 RepID=UPI00222712E0|nr:hypothetical protein [Arthrobacter sp. VKM Ac-2550]MCW2135407.1 hypothetical protein [Arthrobacter sp. VKM Ac-2550]
MAIEFKESIRVTPVGEPESIALRLERELRRLFPGGDSFHEENRWGKGVWSLTDPSDTTSTAKSVTAVFAEFREHDLEPKMLSSHKYGVAGTLGESRFTVHVYYFISRGHIDLDVSGDNRITVDGVAATCRRIKASLEQPESQDSAAQAMQFESREQPAVPQMPQTYGADSEKPNRKHGWKDHSAAFFVTVIGGVLVIALATWLGLSP